MWPTLLIVIVAGIGALFFVSAILKKGREREALSVLKPLEPELLAALSAFERLRQQDWYISDRQYHVWKEQYRQLAEKYDPAIERFETADPIRDLLVRFAERYFHGRQQFIDPHNDNFVKREAPTIERILDAKGIKHNADQVSAIASDEDNSLLVAGAGTGKTTTILGKLAYLTERVGVSPDDILLLSFTGRAVEELSERISKTFTGTKIEVRTFHSFGLSIIGRVLGRKPDLAFENATSRQKWLDQQFEALLQDVDFRQRAVEYFAYYLKPVALEPQFQTLDEYYQYTRNQEHLSLQRERMKSLQEVMIANFLYLNGISYEYERPYPFHTADKDYKQYRPDFFLPKYNLYLEHFGVDRQGRTHFTTNEHQNRLQTERYRSAMAWKRDLHAQNRTVLIETFSYEFTEYTWRTALTERLTAHGVAFASRDSGEILAELRESGQVKEITQLIGTFLDLAKSNGYDIARLQSSIAEREDARERAFLELFLPIFRAYEDYLHATGAIDFHDMLLKAAQFVREGRYRASFKYIIIDEFQDFSVSKHSLVKALCDQNPDAKLFCVGDDWQSIFRFAGSDISLMTTFESAYGFTRKSHLVLTNRFTNSLAVVSNQFILKNPNQIRKEVRSSNPDIGDPLEIRARKTRDETKLFLEEILGSLDRAAADTGEPISVFLLGRYKHNKPTAFPTLARRCRHLKLEYLTVHASKGSEADYVIILDVVAGKHGFPSEIVDDPLLGMVLSKADSHPHAEERRLMYVAMTRARRKVLLITEDGNKSVFALELEGANRDPSSRTVCPECGGGLVQRNGPYGAFTGCENFPDCTYKPGRRRL